MFDVDLVDDTGSRRHHFEVVESRLAPAQELIALTVSLVFQFNVSFKSIRLTKQVGDHRVVNNQFSGGQRVYFGGVSTEVNDGFTHGGEVDDAGNPGEVLHDHAGRRVLDFGVGFRVGVPASNSPDLSFGDVLAIFGAQQVL